MAKPKNEEEHKQWLASGKSVPVEFSPPQVFATKKKDDTPDYYFRGTLGGFTDGFMPCEDMGTGALIYRARVSNEQRILRGIRKVAGSFLLVGANSLVGPLLARIGVPVAKITKIAKVAKSLTDEAAVRTVMGGLFPHFPEIAGAMDEIESIFADGKVDPEEFKRLEALAKLPK